MKKMTVIILMMLMITACSDDKQMINTDETNQVLENVESEPFKIEPYIFAEPIELDVNSNITVFIDPRIEATNLVMEMIKDETGYSMYRDSNYMDAQVKHFSEYMDLPIFDIAKEMNENGFSFDAISGNLHSVNRRGDHFPGLIIDEKMLERAGGAEQLKIFVEALYDFRAVSDYDTYFLENEEFYMRELELAKKHLVSVALTEELLNFYGFLLDEIKVCITPDSMGGFGISNTYENHIDAIPTLPVYQNEVYFISFLVHELSHPYINPQTSLYQDLIEKSNHLFEPIKIDMENQAYPLWEYCLNEHIVRASTYLIMDELYEGRESSKLLSSELDRKFVYIEPIIESLENYGDRRQEYPDIKTYIEVLLTDITKFQVYEKK